MMEEAPRREASNFLSLFRLLVDQRNANVISLLCGITMCTAPEERMRKFVRILRIKGVRLLEEFF